MEMELVLHLAGIILHSGGGKVGDWGRCGTHMILRNIKGKKSTVVTLLKGIKIYFFNCKTWMVHLAFQKSCKRPPCVCGDKPTEGNAVAM